jgi:hypothetical protein
MVQTHTTSRLHRVLVSCNFCSNSTVTSLRATQRLHVILRLHPTVNMNIQDVPLPTKPGSSLISQKTMKILLRDLKSSTFVGEKWRGNEVSPLQISLNILISGKIIKELPGLVGSGTPCTSIYMDFWGVKDPSALTLTLWRRKCLLNFSTPCI